MSARHPNLQWAGIRFRHRATAGYRQNRLLRPRLSREQASATPGTQPGSWHLQVLLSMACGRVRPSAFCRGGLAGPVRQRRPVPPDTGTSWPFTDGPPELINQSSAFAGGRFSRSSSEEPDILPRPLHYSSSPARSAKQHCGSPPNAPAARRLRSTAARHRLRFIKW